MMIRRLSRVMAALAWLAAPLPLLAQTTANDADDETLARGAYLATASDCTACHTAHGGESMAGGLRIASPVGEIVATNITPSTSHGIGNYSEEQFARVLRHGIRADGANLYPAMPYTAYARMSDEDIHALYVYFMHGVAPVDVPTPPTKLPFPMNLRVAMKGWNLLFHDATPLEEDPEQSAAWNRGRYLVEGPTHCSSCHTPRGFMMQELDDQAMAGAQVGPWYAPNITPDDVGGIGSWRHDELVTYLRTGKLDQAQAAGSMAEAITHSFQHLSDDDLSAIATYIEALPPIGPSDGEERQGDRFSHGRPSDELVNFRGDSYAEGLEGESRGAQIYSANCASCHQPDGRGTADGYYPRLFENGILGDENASNLIATILYGVERETEAEGHVFMPPFGEQPNAFNALSNDEIADLSNYLLTHFGRVDENGKASVEVTADDVQTIREGGPGSPLILLSRIGMGVGIVAVVLLGYWLLRRRRAAKR
ncbi:cytochrome c [Halomonas dongshanensis]|uniref:Cytochrome c n=1 Tax=Halomonas dongshanensis TaxID=2890835 RepID=A0ABT2EDL7_9GAMM|nr:cytochrome c [Halomonas dongshanensis]MCS2609645.1 cytochrome c [Halomonas dongshanensis]